MLDHALQSTVTVVLIRCIALVLAFGATVHIANIFGFGERPWSDMPLLWRAMDVVLLLFNVIVGTGLWCKASWAVIAFIAGIVLLQLMPYTLFRSHFIETAQHAESLTVMVVFWLVVLTLLIATVLWRGAAQSRISGN